MTLYRKRPVVVETWEFTKEALRQEDNWVDKYPDKMKIPVWGNEDVIIIDTLEGNMTATLGDFIIKGVEGELYPCKPDIFHKTYEKV